MRSSLWIDVDAPPELVFQLARDVTRWPALLPHYARAHVREDREDGSRVVEFICVRSVVPLLGWGVPVTWRSRCWAEADARRLHFRHLGGATAGMAVTWRIEEAGGGCRVTIDHVLEPDGPFAAARATLVERLFVRPIAGRTLATFRAIAEAAARVGEAGRDGTSPRRGERRST